VLIEDPAADQGAHQAFRAIHQAFSEFRVIAKHALRLATRQDGGAFEAKIGG